jgi:hypothetical protein
MLLAQQNYHKSDQPYEGGRIAKPSDGRLKPLLFSLIQGSNTSLVRLELIGHVAIGLGAALFANHLGGHVKQQGSVGYGHFLKCVL